MARPKGSKNKKQEGAVKFTTKSDVTPVVPMEQKPTPWTPAPEMERPKAPQAPVTAESSCLCDHKKAMHYGGPLGWCNTSGCGCQVFH